MQTTIERIQREAIERQRYDDFEYERRVTDELTEASEKLAMVMHNSFDFELRSDGELYFQDGSIGDVLRNSVLVAEELVKTNPQFTVELIRRRIELQEYDEQRKLALGGAGDPDVLVVLSPIPDAVVAGADLGAYDKKRLKTLARIYERTEDGVRSTSLSLDGTDRKGLQAVAKQFGQAIHDDDGSEDILSMRFWGYASVLHDPAKTVRRRYDEQLERRLGGVWYAGRQDGDVVDALTYIKRQTDIVQAHMERMRGIDDEPVHLRDRMRDDARYNFAAALDRRRYGGTVFGDGGSLSESGGAARSAGVEYSSDCPTGGADGQAASAESATNVLFDKTKKEFVSKVCPMCGAKNVWTTIKGSVISGSCGCAKDVCTNAAISLNRHKDSSGSGAQPQESTEGTAGTATEQPPTESEVIRSYGKNAKIKRHIGIGAVSLVAYDGMTGEIITNL